MSTCSLIHSGSKGVTLLSLAFAMYMGEVQVDMDIQGNLRNHKAYRNGGSAVLAFSHLMVMHK